MNARWVFSEPAGPAADVDNHVYAIGQVMA